MIDVPLKCQVNLKIAIVQILSPTHGAFFCGNKDVYSHSLCGFKDIVFQF